MNKMTDEERIELAWQAYTGELVTLLSIDDPLWTRLETAYKDGYRKGYQMGLGGPVKYTQMEMFDAPA